MNNKEISAGTTDEQRTTADYIPSASVEASPMLYGVVGKREIKFRFWLGHTKKMTYEHSLIDIAHLFWDFTKDIIPLEFTGLFDKNGKEIYEGDIINTGLLVNFFVEYSEKYAEWMFVDTDEMRWSKGGDYNREVLGNIFETPELLKS